ncbi:MAG: HD domain-containing protein [Bacteroidales bacterium]|nr:HD domain-containing protein [Bacteroidales bacterium]
MKRNKHKIINDPVHGFIKIPSDFIFDLLEHPFIQRLRRIKQLGLTSLVYPGATHTRFQHALGAMHLMHQAIDNIRQKGLFISNEEAEAASTAILLHDIGHGPFSHALEQSIIPGLTHEDISCLLMYRLNEEFKGKLDLALQIFRNQYSKKFLHQLVSGQLDMDRMDYLIRDSFYTGVAEGTIGTERIIKMLNVVDDQLVVESKGIYSIEKFLIARRLMYWQVYFHKTVIAAENVLVKTLQRAKRITEEGHKLGATETLDFFLRNKITRKDLEEKKEWIIEKFTSLDDDDLFVSAKAWTHHPDRLLAYLSDCLLKRNLPKVIIQDTPMDDVLVKNIRKKVQDYFNFDAYLADSLVYQGTISNHAYSGSDEKIRILYNNGLIKDLAEASDLFNVSLLTKPSVKYFLCYPKECEV